MLQSLSRQHTDGLLLMQVGLPTVGVHTRWPVGHWQVPMLQMRPLTALQSLSTQQEVMGMHAASGAQNFCMEGQLQEPPAPLHMVPPPQSLLSQHEVCGMQLCDAVHAFRPAVHWQLPPTAVHTSPVTAPQSLLVQQLLSGMH
jgi:hypothetical protein